MTTSESLELRAWSVMGKKLFLNYNGVVRTGPW